MNSNVYTENQKQILLASGVSEERLKEGVLFSAEHKLLKALKAAEEYLNLRYPGMDFCFTGMHTALGMDDQYHFLAVAGETDFSVLVHHGKGSAFDIADSYFGVLKRSELNALVEALAARFGLEVKADLKLAGVYGSDYLPSAALTDMLGSKKAGVYGWVFATNNHRMEDLLPDMERALCEAGLCGGFQLRLVDGVTPAAALERPRTDMSFVTKEISVILPAQTDEEK